MFSLDKTSSPCSRLRIITRAEPTSNTKTMVKCLEMVFDKMTPEEVHLVFVMCGLLFLCVVAMWWNLVYLPRNEVCEEELQQRQNGKQPFTTCDKPTNPNAGQ